MRRLSLLERVAFFAIFVASSSLAAMERTLDRTELRQLAGLKPSQAVTIAMFPVGATTTATIRFERASIFAGDAHIYAETAVGMKELPLGKLIFLRGYSSDGATRVALTLNPDTSVAHGSGSGPDGSFVLHATPSASATTLVARRRESDLPAGFNVDYRCGNEGQTMDLSALNSVATQLQAAAAAQGTAAISHALRFAVVAIDTDSLFMSRLFTNNTTAATDWIGGLFNSMNLMYERDLLVQLRIGTVILRTNSGSDPYSSFTVGATTAELDAFSSYWKNNETGVTRAFAVLLSGVETSTANSCNASGIAWINEYCEKGFVFSTHTAGSYSVNQVCTSIDIDPDGSFNAPFVGHELGHNFGADHTHCTDTTTGLSKTGTNTIDTCFNLESGCYSGTPTCPAAGAGTIMSYCNFTNVSGCADNTQNLLQFHPTHITKVLLPAITTALGINATCLNTTDDIFFSSFE
jgi:hypothetical protein